MEIFTEEFKNELSRQLHELTNVVKKDIAGVMSDSEIAKSMEDCFKIKNKKEKKKKSKKFKEGDIVYLETLQGMVDTKYDDKILNIIGVEFKNGEYICFTKDGRYLPENPIVLSDYPCKLKMKKLKH